MGQHEDDRITNSILGSVAGHPFLEKVIASIPKSIASHPDDSPVVRTGPVLLDRVYKSSLAAGESVPDMMPREYFFPCRGDAPHRRYEVFPDAYAAHHWGGSWRLAYDSPKERLRRILMKLRLTRSVLYLYHGMKHRDMDH